MTIDAETVAAANPEAIARTDTPAAAIAMAAPAPAIAMPRAARVRAPPCTPDDPLDVWLTAWTRKVRCPDRPRLPRPDRTRSMSG